MKKISQKYNICNLLNENIFSGCYEIYFTNSSLDFTFKIL